MNSDILELSKKLISIPSTEENLIQLKEVLEIAKQELNNFKFKEFESNEKPSIIFYNTETLPEKFRIILNAHLDVVPGKENQFIPEEKDGKLYGRGSYDMKSAAASMILLFKNLAKEINYPLGLQLVTDEETGGVDGTKYQLENGIQTEFILAGENTDLLINNKSKGILWLKVITRGKTAHGAYPWLGENAVWKMHQVLKIIEKNYPIPSEEKWQSTINVASLETSNKSYNKIPDHCSALLDIRFIPEDRDNILNSLKKEIGDLAEIELSMDEPSHLTLDSDYFIGKLKTSIKDVTGHEGKTVEKHGGSDVRFYNALGVPGVTFGPIGEGHHSDDEWIDIASLNDYYKILEKFLTSV